MKRWLAAVFSLFGLLGLGGCEPYLTSGIEPGVTRAAEVREHLGAPGIEWRNPDGSVIWEYSMQPAGTRCYHLHIDQDGVVRAVDQVLTAQNMARIVAGMDETQVRRLIGKPAKTHVFALKQETVWDWHLGEDATRGKRYFNVYFDTAGRVTRTGHETVMPEN